MNVTPDNMRAILRAEHTNKKRLMDAFRECIELWETEQTGMKFVSAAPRSSASRRVACRIRKWPHSTRTYRGTKGVCNHIRKELAEIEKAPDDREEWIDVAMLAVDGYCRAGGKPEEWLPDMGAKHAKNVARKWPTSESQDEPIEHLRDRAEKLDRPPEAAFQSETERLKRELIAEQNRSRELALELARVREVAPVNPADVDPQAGDVWGHVDGGSFYVLKRWPKTIHLQRRPFGDSQALPYTITLTTFAGETTGLLRREEVG